MFRVHEGLELSLLTSGEREERAATAPESHALNLMERGAVLVPDLLDVSLLCANLTDLV